MNRRMGVKRAGLQASSYSNLASSQLKRIGLHRSCNTVTWLRTLTRSRATCSPSPPALDELRRMAPTLQGITAAHTEQIGLAL